MEKENRPTLGNDATLAVALNAQNRNELKTLLVKFNRSNLKVKAHILLILIYSYNFCQIPRFLQG